MDMGKKIMMLRKEKGLTLEEVGNRVGVGKSTVRKWESGQIANMRRDKIALIASALDVSPAYLMGWTDNPSPYAMEAGKAHGEARTDQVTCGYDAMSEYDIRMLLSEKLRTFRVKSGMTAKEVGDRIGKSDKTVAGWEHGRGQPDADTLFKLCEIYNIKSIAEFFPERKTGSQVETEHPSDTELDKFMSSFSRLSDENQQRLLDYASILLTAQQANNDSHDSASDKSP